MAVVFATLALLAALFPRKGITVGDATLRFPSIYKILTKEEKPTLEDILRLEASQKREAALNNLQDSIDFLTSQTDSSALRFWFPKGDNRFFDDLFAEMEQAEPKGRTLRILHYGDSQIEMDRISQQLRSYMQETFGGGGPGMQPAWQNIPSLSVSQHTSGAWRRQSSFAGADSIAHHANGNYGPMAQCMHLSGSGYIQFRASKQSSADDRVRHFSQIKVIFNNRPGPLSATLSSNEERPATDSNRTSAIATNRTQEDTTAGVHAFSWLLDTAVGHLHLALNGNADVYAVLVDNGPGVAVDNIPLRGCSGQQFTKINKDQLAAAYSQMDIGLIILQFGGNSVPYLKGEKSISYYAESMGKQIDYLHNAAPQAKILFIGPSDMSTTIDGTRQTYPSLPMVIEALRDSATAHGAAYWSIYDAMGGKNSMVTWVDNGLAVSDYIHFSTKGVRLMGQRLANAFDNMYQIYLLRQRKEATAADTVFVMPEEIAEE